jgi:hypothetical protein
MQKALLLGNIVVQKNNVIIHPIGSRNPRMVNHSIPTGRIPIALENPCPPPVVNPKGKTEFVFKPYRAE